MPNYARWPWIARYEADQDSPRGIGIDWAMGMPEREVQQAEYLVNLSYNDLPFDEDLRRLIAANLAYSALSGEGYSKASGRLLAVTNGQFNCPALANYLQGDPDGSNARDFVNDIEPDTLAYLYAHTRIREAEEATNLKELKLRLPGEAIEINYDGGCKMCDNRKHKFRWSEIESIPKLPLHWGCDCSYQAG